MKKASILLKKIKYFINDCKEYVAGREFSGNLDEVALLSVSIKYFRELNLKL